MFVIKDSIHGNIKLSELERKLLDTEEMQRLRKIKQLALAYLVYPGANHTRFEHSLGTMHLTEKLCEHLELGKEEREELRIAALLHDVGHIAFSHEAESETKKYMGTHEEIGRRKIEKGEIADILSETYRPKKIADLSYRKSGMGLIISSDTGADRMDYLLRDSHYTGVAYGVIDPERIIYTTVFERGKLAVKESGLEAAESLLIARFLMFSTVYLHHTVRIASTMLGRALKRALESEELGAEELLALGDSEVLGRLCEIEASKHLAEKLAKRKLFKEAYSIELAKLQEKTRRDARSGKLEREISEKSGAEALVDIPPSFAGGTNVLIKRGKELIPVSKISDLVNAMEKAEKRRVKLRVICAEENLPLVQKACRKII